MYNFQKIVIMKFSFSFLLSKYIHLYGSGSTEIKTNGQKIRCIQKIIRCQAKEPFSFSFTY